MRQKIAKISQNPGVYIFRSKSGKIIYIGKATNLRNRVRSYFSGKSGTERLIETMIHEVADIRTMQTDSVLEALILESGLIKKYLPRYNAMGKDDKSFSYFVITKEQFPRVVILRQTELAENKKITRRTFGPYASKKQMEIALKIIRKIFPFHSLTQKTEKGCLDFQLGRCPGPYAGAISQEDYQKNICGIRMILEGKKKNLVKKLEREMKNFSNKHEYEKAGELRNKVFALKHIQDVALISSDMKSETQSVGQELRIEAYDISNISGQFAVGSMIVFFGNEPDKSQYRKFKIKTIQGADDVGMMREVLLRRFKNDWPQPDLIFLDGGKGHLSMSENLLKELGMKIPIIAVAKGPNRKNLSLQFSMTQFPNEGKKILSNKNLVKRIMDEAHRFAIGYHKKLRRKELLM